MPLTPIAMLRAALCAATLVIATSPARSAPAGMFVGHLDGTRLSTGLIDQVQYRGQYDRRRYNRYSGNRYRGNGGRNLALGIGSLIIGGIALSESARSDHRREHGGDWQRCAETFRSFEPDTGMYTGYDGERHTCPYLR